MRALAVAAACAAVWARRGGADAEHAARVEAAAGQLTNGACESACRPVAYQPVSTEAVGQWTSEASATAYC